MQSTRHHLAKQLMLTVAAALLAALATMLPWKMSGESVVFAGALFYLVPALWFGPAAGVLAAIPAAFIIWLQIQHPPMAVLPVLEAATIGLLFKSGIRPLFSGVIFWMAVLGVLLLSLDQGFSLHGGWVTAATVPVFGLAAVMLAEAIMHGLQQLIRLDSRTGNSNAQISETLRYWLTFVTFLPLLFMVLIEGGDQLRDAERQAQADLKHKAETLRLVLDNYLNTHLDVLRLQAGQIRPYETWDETQLSTQLRGLWQNYPGFISLLIADHQGNIVAAAFSDDLSADLAFTRDGHGIADRPYFSEPKRSGLPYVSNVFRGRGFGNDILSAISVPLTDRSGDFIGIIEGSLNLGRFDQLYELAELDERHEFIVVDGDDKILFADTSSQLRPLQQYFADEHSSDSRKLIATESLRSAPWTAIAKQHFGSAIAPAISYFTTLIWLLPLAGLIATLIAGQLARLLSSPLENIVSQLRGRVSLVHSHQFGQLAQPPRGYAELDEAVAGINALLRTLGRSYDDLEHTITERDQLNRSLNETLNHMDSLVRQRTSDLADALRAAKSANDAKNIFLAKTSHEIRTPMHAIIGITELLRTSKLDQEQAHYAHLIGDAAESLLALIDEILDFSKIEAGQLEIRPQALHLTELLENVTELMEGRAQQKNLQLQLQIGQVPEWVLLDPVRIRQVLLNLISNAIKFTDSGEVNVELKVVGAELAPRLRFSVTDTGIGIAPDKLKEVFEPFLQLSNPDNTEQIGSGLGLAICKRAVELSGGQIGVESEPAKGSTFWFELPLEQPDQVPIKSRLEGTDQLRPSDKPLLVVDDNGVNRQMLVHQLNYLGFEAEQASGGGQALDYHRDHCAELIWLDCQMPEVDGFEVSRRIRQSDGPQPYIIAITAQTSDDAYSRCVEAGMNDFISKPAKLDNIRGALLRWQQGGPLIPRTPTKTDNELAILDQTVLASWYEIERSGGQAIVQEMLESILLQLREQLPNLTDFAEQQRYPELTTEAHRLKGSSATIGATRVAAVLASLEQACNKQNDTECQKLLTTLASEVELLNTAIDSIPVAAIDTT